MGTLNKWALRLELDSLVQKEGETVEDFICRLKAKANMCSFSNEEMKNEQITFQLIKGIFWPEARKMLIQKGNVLKLEDAIKCADCCYQVILQNTNSFDGTTTASISTFKYHNTCRFCGTSHPPGKCPAYGKII